MITAILRVQWLSIRNMHVRSQRSGTIMSAILLLVWYGMWAFAAYAAFALGRHIDDRPLLEAALPRTLLGVLLYWQLSPLVSATLGASLETRKLLAYPIPHGQLFFIETMLRLSTAVEMLMVLAAGYAGLLLNPMLAAGWTGAGRMAGAMGLFIVFNLLLAAGTRSFIERMLSKRRLREVFMLVLVMMLGAPRLLVETGFPMERLSWLLKGGGDFWLPWGAAGRMLLGEPSYFAVLLVWCVAGYFFGRSQFERNLRFDADAARATVIREDSGRIAWSERAFRLPSALLPDPIATAVEKELRALSRAPRFRMTFIMGFTFGLLVWLPMVMGRHANGSFFSGNFLTMVSVYALALLGQVSYLNAFGFDRAAVQMYFVAPVPLRKMIVAKNIAAATFILLEIALVTAASVIFVPIAPAKIVEAFLATAVSALYLLAVGNLMSVMYPKGANPERVGHSDPARRQGLIFLLFPLTISPLLLAYGARHVLGGDGAFYMALAVVGSLGGSAYWMSTGAAAVIALRRRESMIEELSRGAGPIATD